MCVCVSQLRCWYDTLTPLVCCIKREGEREKGNVTVMGTNTQKANEQTERHVERVMSAVECEICVSNENVMIRLGLIGHVVGPLWIQNVTLSFFNCLADCHHDFIFYACVFTNCIIYYSYQTYWSLWMDFILCLFFFCHNGNQLWLWHQLQQYY